MPLQEGADNNVARPAKKRKPVAKKMASEGTEEVEDADEPIPQFVLAAKAAAEAAEAAEETGSGSEEGEEEDDEDDEEGEESTEDSLDAREGDADEAAVDDASSDDSEDDAPRNRIGNVPLQWYDDEDHVGYDLEGKKVMKTLTTGEIDSLLESKDNPDAWRTIKDHKNQREVVLTDTDLEVIRRIRERMYPSAQTETDLTVEFDNPDCKVHPLSSALPPKSRFMPSKWERMKVKRLVALLREGKILPPPPPKPVVWDLWADEGPKRKKGLAMPLPAPKLVPPGHAESYNPPPEYLLSEEEIKEWEEQDETERALSHLPAKYDALRRVPAYKDLITERFKRCLDLYLVPRALKHRMNVDPESLLPKLPSPKDLRPFPTHVSVAYEGHTGMVRGVAVHSSGEWIATVSSDETLRIWEVSSGRPFGLIKLPNTATAVAWNPVHLFLAVAADEMLYFVDPGLADSAASAAPAAAPENGTAGPAEAPPAPSVVEMLTFKAEPEEDAPGDEDGKAEAQDGAKARATRWKAVPEDSDLYRGGCRIMIACDGDVQQLTWHVKGNYCAAVSPKAKAPSNAAIIHAINSQKSMRPFSKLKGGQVQSCVFHPTKPHFFVATKTGVRIFDLQTQTQMKQLVSGAKWISSVTMHPGGDNIVCGSYDRRIVWFDLDFASKPYKTLQYHDKAIRRVAFHPGKFPLLAAASDDATVSILHAKVFSDLMKSPLIVPVKRLREHVVHEGLGILDCAWHPHQPWLFTAGADHRVFLWA